MKQNLFLDAKGEQQMENKRQCKTEYRTPEIEIAPIDPVWCDGSLDPIQGYNETPLIFI